MMISQIKRPKRWQRKIDTRMVRKAAMHMQFPIKNTTPSSKLSDPRSFKPFINHPEGSSWPLTLISFRGIMTSSVFPISDGPRYKTINTAPETQIRVPPTFARPSKLFKFTLSTLHCKNTSISVKIRSLHYSYEWAFVWLYMCSTKDELIIKTKFDTFIDSNLDKLRNNFFSGYSLNKWLMIFVR